MTLYPQSRVMILLLSTLLIGAGCSTASRTAKTGQNRATAANAAIAGLGEPERLSDEEIEKRVRTFANYATGLSFEMNEDPDQALDYFERAAVNDPEYEPLVIEVARRHLRNQKPEKAIEILKKAAAQPFASGTVYAWLGLAYGQAGLTEPAISANETAIKRNPTSLIPYQNLAQIYLQASRTNDAARVLEQAASQENADAPFLIELAEIYSRFERAQGNERDETRKKVMRLLDRAEKQNPTNPVVLQRLADRYFSWGELTKAEAIYVKLIQDYPQIPALRGKLADIYLRTDQPEKASAQLKALAREDPTNPQTYYFLGAIALEAKDYQEAEDNLERALLLNPALEQAYYDLAGLKLNRGQPQEALDWLAKAREKFRANFFVEFYSGIAYNQLKNYSAAIRHYTSAEVLANTTEGARLNHLFYFQLGAAFERNKDYESAEKNFRKSLEMLPDFADALNYLGYMWAERGTNLEEAHTMIEKAVKLEPDNAAFLDSLGWVLFKLKKPQEALSPILKAVELNDEPDATLYDHLGDVYLALGEKEKAREAWQKSVEIESNDEIKRKLDSLASETPAATTQP